MTSVLYGLLKRDFYFIYRNGKEKIFIALVLLFTLNISYVCLNNLWYGVHAINGISVDDFRQSHDIPYHFILIQLLPSFIIFNFIREDFFSHSSSVIVKLNKRAFYWVSKMISEFILCIVLSFLNFAISYIINNVLISWDYDVLNYFNQVLIKSLKYNVLCSFIISQGFSVVSLITKEINAFVIVIIYLCLGLPTSNRLMIINIFMLKQSPDYKSILFFIFATMILTSAGFILIKVMDIFEKKGDQL